MNRFSPIQNINNAILNTNHASPLQVYGTEQSLERYQYQRKISSLGIDNITTKLEKKFYGNSSNKSASYIAEKKRVNQIGLHSNTLPIQQLQQINNNYNISTQNSALKRLRNRGYILPKKCNNTSIGITPTFNGRNIALNPQNSGGNKWFNLTYNRWNKFCINDIKNNKKTVSGYYQDYLHGYFGNSNKKNINNKYCNIAGGILESVGYAKTYTDIKKKYLYQPYNPSGF